MTAGPFDSSDAAEDAFYAAFRERDFALMDAVLSNANDSSCIHPMGTLVLGPYAVRESWRMILDGEGTPELSVTINARQSLGEHAVVHIVTEQFAAPAGERPFAPIFATNVYRFEEDGWYMILHHASPSPAATSMEAPTGAVH